MEAVRKLGGCAPAGAHGATPLADGPSGWARCPTLGPAGEPGEAVLAASAEDRSIVVEPDREEAVVSVSAGIAVLATVTAVAAAARSTWSPCGLSMLSTITPLAEASRGRRFRSTAAWFVVGALVGGATLGAGRRCAGRAGRRPRPVGRCRARHRRGGRRSGRRRRCGPRRPTHAGPHPPGERGLARALPVLGVRRRLRLADRCRPGHLHHDRGRVPDGRAGGPHRAPAGGAGDRLPVRAGPGPGHPARRPHHQPRRARRLPPPLRRAG